MAIIQLLVIGLISFIPMCESTCKLCSFEERPALGTKSNAENCKCKEDDCRNCEVNQIIIFTTLSPQQCSDVKDYKELCIKLTSSRNIDCIELKKNLTSSCNTLSLTTVTTPTTYNSKDVENNKISVGLAVGLAVLSLLAAVGVVTVGVLLWRRCHPSKSQSSEQISGTTPSVDSNERGLNIPPSHEIKNNYDQILIDDIQNTPYTPLSLESIEPAGTAKSGSTHLQDNNVSLKSGNSALGQIGNANVAYFDKTQKPDNGSIYFESDNTDEHEEEDLSKYSDTNMLLNLRKDASVFSTINSEKIEAESNIPVPKKTTDVNSSFQQCYGDPSTYFELEKHDEIDDTEALSMSTDQYSKLREVSREIDSDYNQLPHVDISCLNEHENTSDTTVTETITSSSNYSLAQIPETNSDNLTSSVWLPTNEDDSSTNIK